MTRKSAFALLTVALLIAAPTALTAQVLGNTWIKQASPQLVSGTRAAAFGDSITCGSTATAGQGYVDRLAAATGWVITNLCYSGKQLQDQNAVKVYSTQPAAGDRYIALLGFNDMRQIGTDATGQTTYQNGLRATLLYLGIPNARKVFAQNAAVSYTGSWTTNTNPYGSGAHLASKYSTTSGATATAVVYGTAAYVGYSTYPGSAGSFTVTIDGVLAGTVDAGTGTIPNSALAQWPSAFRAGGLTNGPHTIVVAASSSAPVYLDYVAGNEKLHDGDAAVIYAGTTLRMTPTGYAGYGPTLNHGSNAVVAQFTAILAALVSDLTADGLQIVVANTGETYTPEEGEVRVEDDVHPIDIGHAHIAQAFMVAINHLAPRVSATGLDATQFARLGSTNTFGAFLQTFNGAVVGKATSGNAFGGDPITSAGMLFTVTYAPGTAESVYGARMMNTVTATANQAGYLFGLSGTLVEAGSGTHALLAGVKFSAPAITSGAASVTDMVTIYITGAPDGTVTGAKYALWSVAGLVRSGGDVIVDTLAGSGNAYACVDSTGKLYRSATPCG